METSIGITYTKCAFCTAKNHCASCGRELSEALAAKPGVTSAVVDCLTHRASVVHDLDEDDLLDMMEGMGIMED